MREEVLSLVHQREAAPELDRGAAHGEGGQARVGGD
jgi:hypothetical protein